MSDSKLRSDLIRLAASSTPAVKAALLPLLGKKTASGFVEADNFETACDGFCKAAGLPISYSDELRDGRAVNVRVPAGFESAFKTMRVEPRRDVKRGIVDVWWKWTLAGGGEGGSKIGVIYDVSSSGRAGYRLEQ